MARDKIIDVIAFDQEIGKLGFDIDQGKSFFQYNPELLKSGEYSNLFLYGRVLSCLKQGQNQIPHSKH